MNNTNHSAPGAVHVMLTRNSSWPVGVLITVNALGKLMPVNAAPAHCTHNSPEAKADVRWRMTQLLPFACSFAPKFRRWNYERNRSRGFR